ncbi:MAG: protein-export chaperone SecB [Proteobacteria bacterium]|jgi:preprotein translocase subunit SecB|nr:protein-export chaperone SecB [Alphaproteobacteria bacterium]NCC03629.1 protein-export chaperone SecB [Pseudomonadota bacterium]
MSQAPDSPQPLQVVVHGQYVQDLSFESPNAPAIFQQLQKAPTIEVSVNLSTRKIEETVHEVSLMLRLQSKTESAVAFIAEVAYNGLFGIPANIPNDVLMPFLYIEAPRLLFPFARAVLANAVRDGGFPQILLNPVDFELLYQQQLAKNNNQIV